MSIINLTNIALFILMYAFRSFTDAIYISRGIESNFLINVKYIILGIAIIFGILQSLVIIYVALAIISFASPMMSETGIIEGLQKSYIGSTMYNNNLLLKIIF